MPSKLSLKDFPGMKAFAIHVKETWLEGDETVASKTQTISSFRYLNEFPFHEPENISDKRQRDYFSVNLVSVLKSTYARNERRHEHSKNFPCSKSDNGRGTIQVVCKILYTEESNSGRKSDAKK